MMLILILSSMFGLLFLLAHAHSRENPARHGIHLPENVQPDLNSLTRHKRIRSLFSHSTLLDGMGVAFC